MAGEALSLQYRGSVEQVDVKLDAIALGLDVAEFADDLRVSRFEERMATNHPNCVYAQEEATVDQEELRGDIKEIGRDIFKLMIDSGATFDTAIITEQGEQAIATATAVIAQKAETVDLPSAPKDSSVLVNQVANMATKVISEIGTVTPSNPETLPGVNLFDNPGAASKIPSDLSSVMV